MRSELTELIFNFFKFLFVIFLVLIYSKPGFSFNDPGFSSQLYLDNPSAEIEPGIDLYDLNFTEFYEFIQTDKTVKDLLLTNNSKPVLVVLNTYFNLNNNDLDYSKIHKIDGNYVVDLFNQRTNEDYFNTTTQDYYLPALISKANNNIGFVGLLQLNTPILLMDVRANSPQNLVEAFERIINLKNEGVNIRAVLSLPIIPQGTNLESVSQAIRTLASNGVTVVAPTESSSSGFNNLCSLDLINLLCVLDVNKLIATANNSKSVTAARARIEARKLRAARRGNVIELMENIRQRQAIRSERRNDRGIQRSIRRTGRDGGVVGNLLGTNKNNNSETYDMELIDKDTSARADRIARRQARVDRRGNLIEFNENRIQESAIDSERRNDNGIQGAIRRSDRDGGLIGGIGGGLLSENSNESQNSSNSQTSQNEEQNNGLLGGGLGGSRNNSEDSVESSLVDYSDFVLGSKFDKLEDSTVSATAFAGVYMNTVFLYPELIRDDLQEVYNVFNIINFIRSSSFAVEYEKIAVASDGNLVPESSLEDYEESITIVEEDTNSGLFGGLFGRRSTNSVSIDTKNINQLLNRSANNITRVYIPKLNMNTINIPSEGEFNQNFVNNLLDFPLYYQVGTFTDIPLVGSIISSTVFPAITPGIVHNKQLKNVVVATPNALSLFFNRDQQEGPAINMYLTPTGQLVETISETQQNSRTNIGNTGSSNNIENISSGSDLGNSSNNGISGTITQENQGQPIYRITLQGVITN